MPNIKLEFAESKVKEATKKEIRFDIPHVMSIEKLSEKGAYNLKNVHTLVKEILNRAFNGAVTKEGIWAKTSDGRELSPGPWAIQKLGIGAYKLVHNIGYTNTSVNVSILQSPGSIKVLEHHPAYFVVETSIDGTLTDMPFVFSLIRVISPPVQP